DLKIVRIDKRAYYENHDTFYVFSFRNNSWSRSKNYNIEDICINHNDVGTFLNGYLHWIVCKDYQFMIMALNLDNMVLSYTPIRGLSHIVINSRLATLHGCLCIIDSDYYGESQLFMSEMNEQGVWSEQCVFISGLEVSNFAPLNILEDGRILMLNNSKNKLVIYDTLKQSYEFLELSQKLDYSRDLRGLNGIEYVETLASPSDLFAV
ncbi:F-box domain containing protein, partial [Tanacetum coccineum]